MGRVDYNIGQNDRAFVRVAYDKGVQASVTDPISPLFNIGSTQPQWSAQFNETHSFGPATSNQFIALAAVVQLDIRSGQSFGHGRGVSHNLIVQRR